MRVNRLLSTLLIISKKGMVTGQELARHFEVSLRTIYRDIDKICEAGVPIASTGGRGGGYYIMENYNIDNLFVNKGEAQALMAVMDSLGVLFGRNQQFNDILLKFENTYKREEKHHDKLSINMSHFSMEDELKEYLYLISKAIEENRLLVFKYINRRMEYSERIAEPIQISFSYGQWYVTAFCRNRQDYRKFKLVRMRKLKLGDVFIKRDIQNAELQQAISGSIARKSIKVILKFPNKMGEQLREYFSRDTIKSTEEGDFIVEEDFPYEEGLIKYILGFGNLCEIIEPQYLREEIKEYLEAMLEKYNS